MSNVIFSRKSSNTALSIDDIIARAPAVLATTQKETLSQRYQPLHTQSLIPVLADYGYVPVSAAQKRTRNAVAAEHTQHMLAFAHVDSVGEDMIASERGEIILYNSHDGTGAVKLFAGAYRFICSNGIVAGDGFASAMKHSAKGLAGFEEMLRGTVEMLPQTMHTIQQLKAIHLDPEQIATIIKKAAATRWGMLEEQTEVKAGTYMVPHLLNALQMPQRINDVTNDANTVFNRIQENIIRGNAMVLSLTKNKDIPDTYNTATRKARPVNSVSENIRINRELWDITTEVAMA